MDTSRLTRSREHLRGLPCLWRAFKSTPQTQLWGLERALGWRQGSLWSLSTGEWQPKVASAQQLKPKRQHGLGGGAVYSQESTGLAQGSGFDSQKLMFKKKHDYIIQLAFQCWGDRDRKTPRALWLGRIV